MFRKMTWGLMEGKQKSRRTAQSCSDAITHLQPDLMECEVKWVLGSITTNKASGGERISAELF